MGGEWGGGVRGGWWVVSGGEGRVVSGVEG